MGDNIEDYIKVIDEIEKIYDTDNKKIKYLYGGITKQLIDKRFRQHLNKENDFLGLVEFDKAWNFYKKPIIFIEITDKFAIEEYLICIKNLENFLINELFSKFGEKCVNSKNKFGLMKQTGGAGINKTNLKVGDVIRFYICFKKVS